MERLPEGSVVINATGAGKDFPGSPVSDAGLFPTMELPGKSTIAVNLISGIRLWPNSKAVIFG